MKDKFTPARTLPRGRIAQWTREQLTARTTTELRQLMDNAKRLNEEELATLCDQILRARPNGLPRAPRKKRVVVEDAE